MAQAEDAEQNAELVQVLGIDPPGLRLFSPRSIDKAERHQALESTSSTSAFSNRPCLSRLPKRMGGALTHAGPWPQPQWCR
jgi:hypothetical protein